MSGDRLAEIEELRRSGQLGAITVSDVLALVDVAKQARRCYERGLIDVTPDSESLERALARLDSGATEGDA